MIKSIFLGIITSLVIQAILVSIDYYFKGYWITPEFKQFVAGTILSGIAFGGGWYSWIEYTKNNNKY